MALEALLSSPAGPSLVNTGDEHKRTALHFAASYGSLESVKALVAAGAEIESRDDTDTYPAVYAFNLRHDDVVMYPNPNPNPNPNPDIRHDDVLMYLRELWQSKNNLGVKPTKKKLGRAVSAGFRTIDAMPQT